MIPEDRSASVLPFGLMSLKDMINCHIRTLWSLCSQTLLEQIIRGESYPGNDLDHPIDDEDQRRIKGWLNIASKVATEFEWQSVHDRIAIFCKKLESPITNRQVSVQMTVLREAIDSGLKWQLIYRYSNDKNKILTDWKADWAATIQKFPSAEKDIQAGVDIWALGHSTASVFHFMRALEFGLATLAADVGKVFDIQNWQNIIDEIESEIRNIGKTLPRGQAKNDRLNFLSHAAKEFVYFKDGWRNYVSHNRVIYDEHQARSVMEHVKSFMTTLSSRLTEVADA